MKKTIISILVLSLTAFTALFSHNISGTDSSVSALTYSDNIGLNFALNPSITVTLSNASGSGSGSGGSNADLIINDLTPGTSSDSNVVIVNVLTNNTNGYELKSNVGSNSHSNYDTRNLVHKTDNNAIFSSIDYDASLTSLIADNTWGYSYSNDNNTWTNYSGLPKYDDIEHIATLKTSINPSASTGDNTWFKIGAKASLTQSSGEYNNIINFIVVGAANPISFYDAFKEAQSTDPTITTLNGYYKMQDMSPTICNAVDVYDDDSHIELIDTRDHEVYWIGKLRDNRCWLLDNLRLGSNDSTTTLTNQDSNINTATYTLPQGVTSGFRSYTKAQINAIYKNDTVTRYGAGSDKAGVYYNFCAASAGTYCYADNTGTGNAQYDICPMNWRLPTGGDSGEQQSLVNRYNTTQDATDVNSPQYNLSIQFSGVFYNSTRQGLNTATRIWSSTMGDESRMYRLGASLTSIEITYTMRPYGFPLRCIANN